MKKINKMFKKVSIVMLAIAFVFGFSGLTPAHAATDPGLGAAASFSVLGNTAITNVSPSVISGDVGLNAAGTNYSGLTAPEVAGTIYASNIAGPATAILPAAVQANASTANGNISGQGTDGSIGPVLDALTVVPGVYDIGAGRLNGGILHLNGSGIYIFRASSDFISSGSISLENGARACDVYWQVNTLATINGSSFAGTIIAGTGVHFGANVTLDGRALAIGGDVTMISDTILGPSCAVPPPAPVVSNGGGPALSAPAPLINITKIPTPLSLPTGPGSVTYNYVVTNVGVSPMSNITVTDDKCPAVKFISGDINNDSKLDVNEVWNYSCTMNLSATTINNVVASGQANGFTVFDTANSTVVVGVPIIPPLIHIVKVPDLFALSAGGGPVTYTYTVTNPGTAPLSDVSVTDDKCTGLPGLVSGNPGDLNQNNLLDSNETWTFTCQTNITQTTTNVGTAEGFANGLTAIDFSPATVNVASPTLPNTGFPPQDIFISLGALVLVCIGYYFYFIKGKKSA